MPSTSSGSQSTLWTIAKWLFWISFFPFTVPYFLIRYFLRQKPELSRNKRLLGSVGIAFGWVLLLSAIPDSKPTVPTTSQIAGVNATSSHSTEGVAETDNALAQTDTKQAIGLVYNTTTTKQGLIVATIPPTTTESVATSTSDSSQSGITTNGTEQEKGYSVVRVIDGDTIDISMNGQTERLRLIGIDTPETVDPRKPVQCFGKEASAKLKALLTGKSVTLEADASQDVRDKYGRLLAYVFLADGTHINLALIEQGYANEYTYRVPYKYQATFKAAALAAKQAKVGLWADDACAGNTTQPATTTDQTANNQNGGNPSPTSQPLTDVVKKSTSDICHEPGSSYYTRTKNYTPYNTLEECLQSGGRLPLR